MNKLSIQKTALHWVDESGDHIVQSPLCPEVTGAGDTEAEAWQIFNEILEDYLGDLKAGRVTKAPADRPRAKFGLQ